MKQTFIYDDTTDATKKFAKWFENNYLMALATTPKRYDWGMNRYQVSDVKATLQRMLKKDKTGFVITDRCKHAHNIGNNNAFEVEYTDGESTIIIGKLHLTDNMYGGILACVSDLEGKKISKEPKLPRAKKTTTKTYESMWWPGHDNIVVHRDGGFWKGFRSHEEFFRFIKDNDGKISQDGPMQTAQTGCYYQYWTVTMKEVLSY